jgi:hypothetical protein
MDRLRSSLARGFEEMKAARDWALGVSLDESYRLTKEEQQKLLGRVAEIRREIHGVRLFLTTKLPRSPKQPPLAF